MLSFFRKIKAKFSKKKAEKPPEKDTKKTAKKTIKDYNALVVNIPATGKMAGSTLTREKLSEKTVGEFGRKRRYRRRLVYFLWRFSDGKTKPIIPRIFGEGMLPEDVYDALYDSDVEAIFALPTGRWYKMGITGLWVVIGAGFFFLFLIWAATLGG